MVWSSLLALFSATGHFKAMRRLRDALCIWSIIKLFFFFFKALTDLKFPGVILYKWEYQLCHEPNSDLRDGVLPTRILPLSVG